MSASRRRKMKNQATVYLVQTQLELNVLTINSGDLSYGGGALHLENNVALYSVNSYFLNNTCAHAGGNQIHTRRKGGTKPSLVIMNTFFFFRTPSLGLLVYAKWKDTYKY